MLGIGHSATELVAGNVSNDASESEAKHGTTFATMLLPAAMFAIIML